MLNIILHFFKEKYPKINYKNKNYIQILIFINFMFFFKTFVYFFFKKNINNYEFKKYILY